MNPKKNKLLTVLATLDVQEWKSLKKYLLRHAGKGSDNMTLIDYLYTKKDKLSELGSQDIHTSKFSMMSSKAVMNMFSRVFLWVEEWISIEEMLQDSYDAELYLIKAYNKKGLFKLADQLSQKLQNRILKDKLLDSKKTEALKTIAHYQYYSTNPIKSTNGVEILQQLTKYHLLSFKEKSLTYLLELHNVNKKREQPLKNEIETIRKLTPIVADTELTDMLYLNEELILNNNYDAFKSLHKRIKVVNPASEIHALFYSYLRYGYRNLWGKNIANDKEEYIELINYGINSGIYTTAGKMPALLFHNLIMNVSLITDHSSTNTFIDKWIVKVKTKDIDSVKSIAQALNNLYNEEYYNLYQLLSNVSYEDTKQKTRGLCMQAIALYMNQEDDLLHDHLSNLKRLIKRNMKNTKGSYYPSQLNLITVIELLSKKRYDSNIVINLSEYSPLFFRSWCKKYVDEK